MDVDRLGVAHAANLANPAKSNGTDAIPPAIKGRMDSSVPPLDVVPFIVLQMQTTTCWLARVAEAGLFGWNPLSAGGLGLAALRTGV